MLSDQPIEKSASCWSTRATIESEHVGFDGHFPGRPVLPAVAQIDLVLALVTAVLDEQLQIISIQKAKFLAPIRPKTDLQIFVQLTDQELSFTWRITDTLTTYSTGNLCCRLLSRR